MFREHGLVVVDALGRWLAASADEAECHINEAVQSSS